MADPISLPPRVPVAERAEILFQRNLRNVYLTRDRVFVWLMIAQWIFAIGMAVTVSPRTWAGRISAVHVHVYSAVLFGGLLCLAPILLAVNRPGASVTRHTIAVAQMLWSALLIHLSGGRIETHFHVFGSLAFLAFYRDWRVLISATLVVVLDHLLRGIFWPESVYGISNPEWWRFLEHAGWVVFEDIVLVMGVRETVAEMRTLASRQAELESLNVRIEEKVVERTQELKESNEKLQESLDRLNTTQKQLVEASRKSGMADVATAVLHNVGNVLNSVNVSASMLIEGLRRSKAKAIPRTAALLDEHADNLAGFLSTDERGKKIPMFLGQLGEAVQVEQEGMLKELNSLQKNIDHIKVIVDMQQTHAKASGGAYEVLSLNDVLEDAIKLNEAAWVRHAVSVQRDFASLPSLTTDRHKVLQIVMNLFSNASHAVKENPAGARNVFVRTWSEGDRQIVEVKDTGCGIAPENMARIFSHGFTTKKEGHGFGLHSSANAASELGGALTVSSEGVGQGAVFRLEIPSVSAARSAA